MGRVPEPVQRGRQHRHLPRERAGRSDRTVPCEVRARGRRRGSQDQWEASKQVQQRMRALGIKDEMAMQSHIIKRLEIFLEKHDRRLIGWDEILEGGLPPQATVMSWQGTEGGLAAASAGHDVVMSPVGYLYLDYLQTASPNEPPVPGPGQPRQAVQLRAGAGRAGPTSASTFSVCRPTCSPSTRAPTHACSTTCSRAWRQWPRPAGARRNIATSAISSRACPRSCSATAPGAWPTRRPRSKWAWTTPTTARPTR